MPVLTQGKDAFVRADTGSGKTMVYAAPIVSHLQGLSPKISRFDGTHAIILAPTRELCLQIESLFTR